MTRIGLKVAGVESGEAGYGLIVKGVVKGALGLSRPLEEFRLRFEDGCDVVVAVDGLGLSGC